MEQPRSSDQTWVARVLPKGQITIPRDVRDTIQLTPGGTVQIRVIGPNVLQVEVLTRKTLRDFLAEFHTTEAIDVRAIREEWESEAAQQVIDEVERDRDQ